jgi:ferredoxin
MNAEVYQRLAAHLRALVMGYPFSEALLALLAEMYTPAEAEVLLGLPTDLDPLEVAPVERVAAGLGRPLAEIAGILESLAGRGLLYSGRLPDGARGYALLQMGYGMPKAVFWAGREDQHAKRMADLVARYFSPRVIREIDGGTGVKSHRYIPRGVKEPESESEPEPWAEVSKRIDALFPEEDQGVDAPGPVAAPGAKPFESLENIITEADKIAVANCACRISARAAGHTDSDRRLEVCLKYDELAEYVADRGLGRLISADEALQILANCEEEGLVHMVDNAQGPIKQTCNCDGDYCWNLGLIKRREVPRDELMAVYFRRVDRVESCLRCGACVDACPINAVKMKGGMPKVDADWCIGCGVCASACPVGVISLERLDRELPPESLADLFDELKAGG